MNCSAPIRRNALITPDATAILRSDGSEISYAALDRTLDALGHRIRELGLRPGHAAAIVTGDAHRYLVVLLALARIGVTGAAGGLPPALAEVVLSDYAPGTVNHPRVVQLDELWPAAGFAGDIQPVPMHTDDAAIFVLSASSGTSAGMPKFAPVSHDLMTARTAGRVMHPPFPAGSRHCCFVSAFTGFGLTSMLRTLTMGLTVVEPNPDGGRLAAWLVASRVSHITISPIGLQKILDALPAQGVACDVRTIEISGGILPLSTYQLAQRRLPAMVIVSYGSTETGNVASAPYAAVAGRPDAVGYAFPGITVQVVDADGNPLPAGQEGILRIRSPSTTNSYRGNDTASARVFRDGWVYPNDRAILDNDGLLRVTGRTDDVIVIEGVKVNPQAVEEMLMRLADLREVTVFGVPDATGSPVVCAAIVPNAPLDREAFHALCRERLGARAPVFIMHLKELPRNAMGKVQRTELVRMAVEADRARSARPS